MDESAPKPIKRARRWFSITVRGVMLLILILGVLMGWKARRANRQRSAVARVQRLGGAVIYDWQYGGRAYVLKPGRGPSEPAWLRKLVGDDYFQDVLQVNLPAQIQFGPEMGTGPDALEEWSEANKAFEAKVVTPLENDQLACLDGFDRLETLIILQSYPIKPEGWTRLGQLQHLKELSIGNNIDGESLNRLASLSHLEILSFTVVQRQKNDLSFLSKMPRLHTLNVSGLNVSDDHLAQIGQVHRLKYLTVWGQQLTDEGLAHLKNLKSLEDLSIFICPKLTGDGLVSLEGLPELQTVFLGGMSMNKAGLEHLRKLPKLKTLSISGRQLDTATLDDFKAARPGVSVSVQPSFGPPSR